MKKTEWRIFACKFYCSMTDLPLKSVSQNTSNTASNLAPSTRDRDASTNHHCRRNRVCKLHPSMWNWEWVVRLKIKKIIYKSMSIKFNNFIVTFFFISLQDNLQPPHKTLINNIYSQVYFLCNFYFEWLN